MFLGGNYPKVTAVRWRNRKWIPQGLRTISRLMVNGVFAKSAEQWDHKMNAILTSRDNICLTAPTTARSIPKCPVIFPTPFPYHSPAKLGDKRNKKRISRETQWVFSMRTQRMKHADILQGRQKKCPLEQLQQSAGQRRRGWPWQITNKRMDKTSLARQKPPWKSTVSRKGPETRYSYFIGLLVLLSSSSK